MSDVEAPVSRQVVQRAAAKPENAGAKCTVYCKLPNGIRIRNFKMVPQREQVMGGGIRDFHIAEPDGPEYLINGNRFRIGLLGIAPVRPVRGSICCQLGIVVVYGCPVAGFT